MAEKKTDSRKFVVWLVWLIVSLLVIALCVTVIIVTKDASETMVNLIEKILSFFFAVSMMYLGVNVGQKIGFSIADALSSRTEHIENEFEGNNFRVEGERDE